MAGRPGARVYIPFADALSELMPVSGTRLRRDFPALLSFVRAHALVYQAQRETDQHGRITATLEGDYAAIRDLVGGLIAEGIEASVSDTTRETVEAVRALLSESSAEHVPRRRSSRGSGSGDRRPMTGYIGRSTPATSSTSSGGTSGE